MSSEQTHSERLFLEICGEIFRLTLADSGVTISREYLARSRDRADLVALKDDLPFAVAEVNLYRSFDVPLSWIQNAAFRAVRIRNALEASRAYLMVSCSVTQATQARIEKSLGVQVIGREALYAYSARRPDIVAALDSVFPSTALSDQTKENSTWQVWSVPFRDETELDGKDLSTYPKSRLYEKRNGADLCASLRDVTAGQRGAKKFEQRAKAALEYIFDDQLSGWVEQPRQDDGLRVDVAAKVWGNHDFWRELIRDFKTRFVLFECKNYPKKISQAQIYTTEKYLFRKALRSVAIIVSPQPPDSGAVRAIKGAIRESGKLMLWLTVDEICKMLELKNSSRVSQPSRRHLVNYCEVNGKTLSAGGLSYAVWSLEAHRSNELGRCAKL